jgi:hypothetical protein
VCVCSAGCVHYSPRQPEMQMQMEKQRQPYHSSPSPTHHAAPAPALAPVPAQADRQRRAPTSPHLWRLHCLHSAPQPQAFTMKMECPLCKSKKNSLFCKNNSLNSFFCHVLPFIKCSLCRSLLVRYSVQVSNSSCPSYIVICYLEKRVVLYTVD